MAKKTEKSEPVNAGSGESEFGTRAIDLICRVGLVVKVHGSGVQPLADIYGYISGAASGYGQTKADGHGKYVLPITLGNMPGDEGILYFYIAGGGPAPEGANRKWKLIKENCP